MLLTKNKKSSRDYIAKHIGGGGKRSDYSPGGVLCEPDGQAEGPVRAFTLGRFRGCVPVFAYGAAPAKAGQTCFGPGEGRSDVLR